MAKINISAVCLLTVLLAFVGCSHQPEVANRGNEGTTMRSVVHESALNKNGDSCWNFAQSFYDWYVPYTNFDEHQKLKGPSSNVALKLKRDAFTPELFIALKADSDAQAHSDELVGIDFDPFLNTQDPQGRYEVRAITRMGIHCRTEVYGIGDEQKAYPDVAPDLVLYPDGWRFVNFYYPGPNSTDLVKILRDGAKMRKGSSTMSSPDGH